jgi:hypothetical protein
MDIDMSRIYEIYLRFMCFEIWTRMSADKLKKKKSIYVFVIKGR